MLTDDHQAAAGDQRTATWIDLAIRIAVLGLLVYLSFLLIRPFITIAIWSIVLAVALYPTYERIVLLLGGRRKLAAVALTLLNLLILIGPVAWLVLGLIDSIRGLTEQLDLSTHVVPSPPEVVKSLPLVGETIFQFWQLASDNLQEAWAKIAPHLKSVGAELLQTAAEAGMGTLKFLVAIVVAGLLFPSAPALAGAVTRFSRRVALDRGGHFVDIAVATTRAVARGVIGVSVLQALLIGAGLVVAGIPGASLITSIALIFGILQIGPTLAVLPVIIWVWMTRDTTMALLFTAYMVPVNLLDNVLRPLVMGRGLDTPTVVILIGLIGGTISLGLTGLFLGPIILAVIWELLVAWIKEHESAQD
ncbi:MAG: AI-2E family transporter [Xanthobacteraceae bacterium]